jgi:glutamyl-Q tRNA(Asp) synthetase
MTEVTRFAPSPTGRLHLGHAFAAVVAASRGRFLLRVEDIDPGRCRPEYVAGIAEDLAWLGLEPAGTIFQSGRIAAYRAALGGLAPRLYPCTCTRTELAAAAPHAGEVVRYPGTCRGKEAPPAGVPFALRLNLEGLPTEWAWEDVVAGPRSGRADAGGDPVLWRKDDGPAYHLACVVDDAHQGVTLVTRGHDLEAATPLQRLLQELLGLPVPRYLHHRLLLGADGRRLAKRDRAATLDGLREAGVDGRRLASDLRRIPSAGPDFEWTGAAGVG